MPGPHRRDRRRGGSRTTRRRALRVGGAAAIAALAGCSAYLDATGVGSTDGEAETGGGRTGPDADVAADLAPLYVYSPSYDAVYPADAIGEYTAEAVGGRLRLDHPDTDAVDTHLSDGAFSVSFTGLVTAPVTVVVNLTSAGLPSRRRDPTALETNPLALAGTLAPTVAPDEIDGHLADVGASTGGHDVSVDSDRLEEVHLSLDLSDVALPRNVTVHADVCLLDPRTDRPRLLAHHGALPLAYEVDGAERVRWLDESARLRHGRAVHEEPATGVHRSFTADDHHVSYGVVDDGAAGRWAVAVAQPVAEMERYADDGETGWYPHALAAANTAHEDPTMRRFARRFAATLDAAGIRDPLRRLDALADYVQTLPYRIPEDGDRKPTYVLYAQRGDCSERTFLFGAVCRCEPWATRVGYVYGQRGGTPHTLPAIHLEDLHGSARPLEDLSTVRPADLPRTIDDHRHADDRFALAEVTADRERQIGEFEPNGYELEYFYGTNYWSAHDW